jgi:CRP/FNR family cyclic AMP-dependent transcriptional regulator
MQTLYGLPLSDNCPSCKFRRSAFFCRASPAELKAFDSIKSIAAFPAGAVLFSENQPTRGILQICAGRVRVSIGSNRGKRLTLKIAGPGDVLGMAAVVSGSNYEVMAETLKPCQLAFVSDRDFLWYLHKYPAAFQRAANDLALQYNAACEQLSVIGLRASVFERLVRFLLEQAVREGARENQNRFSLSLSQRQIGQYIGTSRESVSRAFSALKKRGLLENRRSMVVMPDRIALTACRLNPGRTSGVGPRLVRLPTASLPSHAPEVPRLQRESYGNQRKRA